jgi:uncharacterized protein
MGDLKAFQEQVKKGELNGVKAALADDPSLLDAVNEAGQGSFLLAKYYRQQQVADYLLSLHPKLDIFSACAAGQTESVLKEIDSDASLLEAHSPDGWTPLHLAAFFGQTELAKGLLNHGAAVNSRSTNPMKNTPLHAAAAGNSMQLVQILLDHGADANAQQNGGWTALHAAAQTGNLEMTEILLEHGALVGTRADNNQCALDLALLHAHEKVARILEKQGARLQ